MCIKKFRTMSKPEVDSILLANWYYTKCSLDKPTCEKTQLAKKYLVNKINKALTERMFNRNRTFNSVKALIVLLISVFVC